MAWKGWSQKKRLIPKRRVKSEQGKLVPRAKDRPSISIEEIRRKGLILAGQGFGEGARSRPSVQRQTKDECQSNSRLPNP